MAGTIYSVVVKIAERCNLNCSYCYIYNHEDQSWRDRPKLMSDAVFEQLLVRMREYSDRHAPHRMSLIFHGGEPTLVGARRLDRLAGRAKDALGDRMSGLALQTNGTLIGEAWLDVIRRHSIRVGVSLDGPAEIHDATRVDHFGRGSHKAVIRGLKRRLAAGLNPGVLCVVSPGRSGLETYQYFRSLGIRRMNFLLPLARQQEQALRTLQPDPRRRLPRPRV
jgi:uncharacterized protein